ncbi:MAG: hypothetical protein ACJATK_001012 [Paracoccaceae bacterium]|jgi:hypothetical protein
MPDGSELTNNVMLSAQEKVMLSAAAGHMTEVQFRLILCSDFCTKITFAGDAAFNLIC